MRNYLIVAIVAFVGLACFVDDATAAPYYKRYDYYYGPGSAPVASSYSNSYSRGYNLVPPASSYYNPYAKGYNLIPPGSYYYSPAYPPVDYGGYAYPTNSYGGSWFNW